MDKLIVDLGGLSSDIASGIGGLVDSHIVNLGRQLRVSTPEQTSYEASLTHGMIRIS